MNLDLLRRRAWRRLVFLTLRTLLRTVEARSR